MKFEGIFCNYFYANISRHPVTLLSEVGSYLKGGKYELGEKDFYLHDLAFY
jgi:hypothetical protein